MLGYEGQLAAIPPARWLEARAAKAQHGHAQRRRQRPGRRLRRRSGHGHIALRAGRNRTLLVRLTPAILESSRLSLVYRKEVLVAEHIQPVLAFLVEVMTENADQLAGQA